MLADAHEAPPLQVLGPLGSGEPIDLAALLDRAKLPHDQSVRVWLDVDHDGRFTNDEVTYEGAATHALDGIRLSESQRRSLHRDDPRTVRLRLASGGRSFDFGLIAMPRTRAVTPIRLRSGRIDAEALPEPIRIESGRHHVIQFARIPSADEKAELEELGVALLGYIPDRSFWARIEGEPERVRQTSIAGGLVLARPATADVKLDASLSTADDASQQLAVHFFADASQDEMTRVSALLAKASIKRWESDYAVIARPSFALEQLTGLEGVQWVEPYVEDTRLHSAAGNLQHRVTPLRSAPYSLDGTGVKVAVFDAFWIDGTHPDLAPRIITSDQSLLASNGIPVGSLNRVGAHATHMAGVIASSGAGNADAIGAAPQAVLYSYLEAYTYQNPNATILAQSSALGWRIINHSYGSGYPCADPSTEPCKSDPHWASYIQHAADADTWATQAGVISIYSAGNDGAVKQYPDNWPDENWQTIYSGAVAKNVIATCGASKIANAGETYSIRVDTSKGPTSDGRVKPDLCAVAVPVVDGGIVYTTELNGGYTTTQATSGAAAQVTGIVALLMQAYRNALGQPEAQLPPDLARGLLIHSADDMTEQNAYHEWYGIFDSHAAPGPDYTTGWGYANAQAAVDLLRASTHRGSQRLFNGQLHEYEVTVPAGQPLKVTLAWTDPPASVGTGRALVNDLDLSVSEVGSGATYYPWVLDKDQPMQPATTGINVVDNVEQVVLTNTTNAALTYRIAIRASAVPQGPQAYQLLTDYDLSFDGPPPATLPPSANFSVLCASLECDFTDASTDPDGSVVTRLWNFGDGTTSQQRNPRHLFAAPGSYNVTLTVTDDTNLTATRSSATGVTSCFTAVNSAHYTAGRATRTGFLSYTYYAVGSGTKLGAASTSTSLQGGNGSFDLVSSCPAPLPAPPTVSSISASVSNGVVTVSGTASDINNNVSRVEVAIVAGAAETRSTATGTSSWSRSISGLAPGSYSAYAQAFDSTNLMSTPSASVPFTIPVPTPEQCFTAANSAHYSAGRATRKLQLFTYYYFAVGSNESLGQASTTTSLRGTPGNWRVVTSCP
ncbi:MAG: S8 family serine peptidase [Myxococcales bacterium]